MEGKGFMRMNVGTTPALLMEGLEKMRAVFGN